MSVTGINEIMTKLNAELARIEGRTMKGLLEAVRYIRGDMERTPPLIPVNTNNLRASWFVSSIFYDKKPIVMFGFGADYAAFVHEMVGTHFKRPGAGAKFLEAALKRNEEKILSIVREQAKIR